MPMDPTFSLGRAPRHWSTSYEIEMVYRTQWCTGMATYVPKGFVLCPVSQPCPLVGLETTRGEERRPPVALSSSPCHLSWAAVECAALRLWDVNAGLTRRHRHHQWPTNLQPHHTDHSGSRVTLDQTNSSPPKRREEEKLSDTYPGKKSVKLADFTERPASPRCK